MLRSVLLALDAIAEHGAALDAAVTLAARTGASLHVRLTLDRARIEAPEAVPLGGEAFRRHLAEANLERLEGKLDALAASIDGLLKDHGIDGHVALLDDDAVRELTVEAESHDLMVLSNALRRRRSEESNDIAFALPVDELVGGCVRPVLLVDAQKLEPGDAVVAYDGSPAAARVIQLAILLGLFEERSVHVVSVAAGREEAERVAARAALLLARHGLQAHAHGVPGQGGFGDELLAQIEAIEPALVAMGAFGRRSWRELLFGAVTRHLVDRVAAPTLICS